MKKEDVIETLVLLGTITASILLANYITVKFINKPATV